MKKLIFASLGFVLFIGCSETSDPSMSVRLAVSQWAATTYAITYCEEYLDPQELKIEAERNLAEAKRLGATNVMLYNARNDAVDRATVSSIIFGKQKTCSDIVSNQ